MDLMLLFLCIKVLSLSLRLSRCLFPCVSLCLFIGMCVSMSLCVCPCRCDAPFHAGYIQTPGWDPDTNHIYPIFMNSWVHVPVPDGHLLMLSAVHLLLSREMSDCKDRLAVYAGSSDIPMWTLCAKTTRHPPPKVLDVSDVYVHFRSGQHSGKKNGAGGFRLLFSFHQVSCLSFDFTFVC